MPWYIIAEKKPWDSASIASIDDTVQLVLVPLSNEWMAAAWSAEKNFTHSKAV